MILRANPPPSPSRRCASLHYLSLSYCTHFTSKGLHSIVAGKGCRRLVHLDLSGCTQLTVDGMHFLGKGCPILNTLVLDDLPDISDSMILVSDTLLSPLPPACSSLPPLFRSWCHTATHCVTSPSWEPPVCLTKPSSSSPWRTGNYAPSKLRVSNPLSPSLILLSLQERETPVRKKYLFFSTV